MKLRIDQLTPGDFAVRPDTGAVGLVIALAIDRDGDAHVEFGDDVLVCFRCDRVEQVGSLRAGARARFGYALF